jgi:hypothetical protein
MMTSGPRTTTETTIRMCTRGDGWHGTAPGRGGAGCSGTAKLSYRSGRKGARRTDKALVDGYPRQQRRQVTASCYTLLLSFVLVAAQKWRRGVL